MASLELPIELAIPIDPLGDRRFGELQENALAARFTRGQPSGITAGEGRLDSREADPWGGQNPGARGDA